MVFFTIHRAEHKVPSLGVKFIGAVIVRILAVAGFGQLIGVTSLLTTTTDVELGIEISRVMARCHRHDPSIAHETVPYTTFVLFFGLRTGDL